MCPAVEPRFTTWPRRRATMCGRIARVTLSNPFRFVSIMRSQSSGSPSWILDIPLARLRAHARRRVALAQVGAEPLESIDAARPQHQLRALRGEAARARRPDPRARPRDQNQLPLDAIHTSLRDASAGRCGVTFSRDVVACRRCLTLLRDVVA